MTELKQSLIPLINSVSPVPKYNGYEVKLGEDANHLLKAPNLQPINGKIVFLCIGASTPGQISTVLESKGKTLTNVKIINCCVGAEDINDWLNENGSGWTNIWSKLKANKLTANDVQGLILCNDDLKSQDTSFASCTVLSNKIIEFVMLAKESFTNLKEVDLFSRLCEFKITDPKFQTPSGYNTGWANKLTVETSKGMGGFINGVWVTDGTGYLWTDGEARRSDNFQFFYAWMKQRETSIHLDTRKEGDDICADFIFNNMKRYNWFR